MLSKRAKNTIKRIGKELSIWRDIEEFKDLSQDEIEHHFEYTKRVCGTLHNAGTKTLKEILELHATLKEVWG